jgi:hypothetical protein
MVTKLKMRRKKIVTRYSFLACGGTSRGMACVGRGGGARSGILYFGLFIFFISQKNYDDDN